MHFLGAGLNKGSTVYYSELYGRLKAFSLNVFLPDVGADLRSLNMMALTKGELHSSFWVVDRKHLYIGSAAMDWRALSTVIQIQQICPI